MWNLWNGVQLLDLKKKHNNNITDTTTTTNKQKTKNETKHFCRRKFFFIACRRLSELISPTIIMHFNIPCEILIFKLKCPVFYFHQLYLIKISYGEFGIVWIRPSTKVFWCWSRCFFRTRESNFFLPLSPSSFPPTGPLRVLIILIINHQWQISESCSVFLKRLCIEAHFCNQEVLQNAI